MTMLEKLRSKLSKSHKHKFIEVNWDRNKYGKDFIPLNNDSLCAEYKYLQRCSCGEERVITSFGYI